MKLTVSIPQAIKIYLISVVLFFICFFIYLSIPATSVTNQNNDHGDMQKVSDDQGQDAYNLLLPKSMRYGHDSDSEVDYDSKSDTDTFYYTLVEPIDHDVNEDMENNKSETTADEPVDVDPTEAIVIDPSDNTTVDPTENKEESSDPVIVDPFDNTNVGPTENKEDSREPVNDPVIVVDPSDQTAFDPNDDIIVDPIENVPIIVEPSEFDEQEVQDSTEHDETLRNESQNSDVSGSEDEQTQQQDDDLESVDDQTVNFDVNEIFTDVPSDHEPNIINTEIANITSDPPTPPLILSKSELFQLIETIDFDTLNNAIQNVNEIEQIWDEEGYNLLHRATAKYSVASINAFLARAPAGFVNEKTRDKNSWNCVHLLIENSENKGLEEISGVLNILVQRGADLNAVSGTGSTPLHLAVISDNVKAMEALLICGADANFVYEGLPLLHHSIIRGGIDSADLLLKHNANPLTLNKYNRAALHEAAFNDKAGIVRLLVFKHECDVNIRTPAKSDPEKLRKKDLRAAEFLYDATPLHYAIKGRNPSTARQLIISGADKNAKDSYGKTTEFYDDCGIMSLMHLSIKI